MRKWVEDDLPRRRCFSVESKDFEIEKVGDGKKVMVVITERRQGKMSWIRFGEEGAKFLLKCVELLRAEAVKNTEGLVWCEKGRRYSMKMRKKEHGRALLCSVTDLDGKRHRLILPEGNDLVNGWNMLEKALQELGHKEDRGDRGKVGKTHPNGKEEIQKGRVVPDITRKFSSPGESRQKTVWVDIREHSPTVDLGALKYGVVGCWKVLLATKQTLPEVVEWAKRVWSLKGRIAIHPLNQKYFFMGFELSEEAMRVMENGSRICRGGVLQLEWWPQSSGCKGIRDKEEEVWIRVVGLPLHLWTGENLKKVGDSCGGFVAMDEGTASKTDLLWARILVKMNNNAKHDSVYLIAGDRVYVVQIWWEIRPTVVEVTRKSCRDFGGPADIGEEDDRDTRAKGRVNPERKANCQISRNGRREVGNRNGMGNRVAAECLEIGQTCGGRFKVGDKQKSVFQNAGGNRGRNGKSINSHVMDPLKDRAGLYLVGAAAQGMGQILGCLKGPSIASPGEKNEWPTGRNIHINPRFACKGGSKEKMGTETHRREKASEGETSAGENRGFHESKSSQDQGRSKGYNKKQATSRKERYTNKVSVGSEEEEEEEDEGRCCGASEQESVDGKIPEEAPTDVDMEVAGAKNGFLCIVVESSGSVLKGTSQAGGNFTEMSTGDLRIEVEGEEDLRAGKRVGSEEVRLGSSDGIRPESSGRERHFHREEQEETHPNPGQILGAGRGSGTERASGRELGQPNVSNPVMGLFYRGALNPVSSIRALFNGMSLYEPSCSKAKAAVLEPGLSQDLLSKSAAKPGCFGSTFLSSEEGQKGNTINHGKGDEIGETAGQEDGHSFMNRYEDNRYSQHSPISIYVFGFPLLSGGFFWPGGFSTG